MQLAAFERERSRLVAIATRVLGSPGDADDLVQEAWLRFSRTEDIDDAPAWLTTVVTRLCLDLLRRRRTRVRAESKATQTGREGVDPEADALLADRVGGAMQLMLDALVPAERAAFVLHDAFGYSFPEIAQMLGRSDAAVRQLASRARRKVHDASEPLQEAQRRVVAANREVVEAFLSAAQGGDLSRLMSLLAPDVVMRADSAAQAMGTQSLYDGPESVAGRFRGAQGARPVLIDGDPGVAWMVNGRARVVFCFQLADGLVRAIDLVADREVMATMEIIPMTREA
ncbi:MAG TPA: sigma-70 family RNA polymerase sigma factor [Lacisediminihabitans sp.]|uniref:sigma-70 family RNA polymerase sigma factor n=1 Tax=Lacisediminihabitans sp. TaxID=2787631 RepID=UPI002EDB5716